MNKRQKLERCHGCRNNRYNMPEGWREGPNDAPVDGKGCWNLPTAKSAHRAVWYSSGDIYPTLRKNTLSCWSGGYSSTTVTLSEFAAKYGRKA